MRLKDRVVIVTGGSHGIGKAFVEAFAAEGAKVAIASHVDLEASQKTATAIEQAGGEALALPVDVVSESQTLEMARRVVDRFGRIDVLVNNAAVFIRNRVSKGVPCEALSLEEWDRVMDVNVKGVFLCCRAVIPVMKRQGYGKILNISSAQFFKGGGQTRYAHYVASKGAVIGLTRALARELGAFNINVNCLAPGSTYSEDPSDEALRTREKAAAERCISRVGYPQDLQGTAVFLASAESDFLTGQTLVVDGGTVMN